LREERTRKIVKNLSSTKNKISLIDNNDKLDKGFKSVVDSKRAVIQRKIRKEQSKHLADVVA
jgi:hypothetical protein